MWGPILEKAWAKMKGSYNNAEGGMISIRQLTGAYVYQYWTDDLVNQQRVDQQFALMSQADEHKYIMEVNTHTREGGDSTENKCGMANSHTYSILGVFTLKNDKVDEKCLLLRNPWGESYPNRYRGKWSHDDPDWTDELAGQVPMGIDPRKSNEQGFFVLPFQQATAQECINDILIGH